MKCVMISIRPEWCAKIATGEKTIEVRRTKPKLEPPFKCYIYCTSGATLVRNPNGVIRLDRSRYALCGRSIGLNMKVIGEFICDKIIEAEWDYKPDWNGEVYGDTLYLLNGSCLSEKEIISYGKGDEVNGYVYGWHISNLIVYEKPKALSDFSQCHKCEYYQYCFERELSCNGAYRLNNPPQSWCYVEEQR